MKIILMMIMVAMVVSSTWTKSISQNFVDID